MPLSIADLIWEGLSCYLAPARIESWGGRSSWRGREGSQGIDILFLFLFFLIPLNKCHFLRQKKLKIKKRWMRI
jgi:hypothetical protein